MLGNDDLEPRQIQRIKQLAYRIHVGIGLLRVHYRIRVQDYQSNRNLRCQATRSIFASTEYSECPSIRN